MGVHKQPTHPIEDAVVEESTARIPSERPLRQPQESVHRAQGTFMSRKGGRTSVSSASFQSHIFAHKQAAHRRCCHQSFINRNAPASIGASGPFPPSRCRSAASFSVPKILWQDCSSRVASSRT